MASDWFVEKGGKSTGPFTAQQLKAQVAAKVLQAETKVRKGRKGRWVAARQVRGLFASSGQASQTSQESSTAGQTGIGPPKQRKAHTKQHQAPESNDGTYLTHDFEANLELLESAGLPIE